MAGAGAEVHRYRRGEPAPHRRRRRRHQPHQLLRLHVRRPARLQAAPGPQGAVHGEERGLRQQGHRADHAQPAAHRGGPRQRRRVVRGGLPARSRKASWSASTRRPRSAAASRSRSSSPARPAWRSPPTCRSSRTSSGAPSASGPRAIPRRCGAPRCRSRWRWASRSCRRCRRTELTALLHSRMQHLLERVQDAYGPHPPGEFWVPHRLGGGAPSLAEANRMDAEEASREGRPSRATGRPHRGAGVARMEPVFRTLEIAAKVAIRATGTRITYHGLENIPATGGAVIAINHTSYVDFLPAALAAHYRKRRLRFMIKAEMQDVKVVSFLIKHTGTIPVDRTRRCRRVCGRGASAAGRGARRRVPRSDHQPQLRAEGVQDRRGADGAGGPGADRAADRLGRAAGVDEGPPEVVGPQEVSDHRVGRRADSADRDTASSSTPRCASR